MNKEPSDPSDDINSLKARVTALETWVAWFKSYLLSHPGGVTLLGNPPPGEDKG